MNNYVANLRKEHYGELQGDYTNLLFKTEPYKHQMNAFIRFKDAEYFGLFMDMGTGKSKVAIDIASYKFMEEVIDAVLIIAPNHVHTQWVKEQYPAHCGVQYKAFEWQSGKHGTKRFQAELKRFMRMPTREITPWSMDLRKTLKVMAVNVEALQSRRVLPYIDEFLERHNVFIIVDEATRIKTPTAARSRNIHNLGKSVAARCRCVLTGTPTAKSPFDLWSMFEFLKHDYFGCNYFLFRHRYGIMVKASNFNTGRTFETLIDEKTFHKVKRRIEAKKQAKDSLVSYDYDEISAMDGISEKDVRWIETMNEFAKFKSLDELKGIIGPDVFSIRKEQCLDLPEKVYERVFVDLSKDQKRIYNNLKNELLAEYQGQELTVQNKIELTTRLMQVCGGFFPCMDGERKLLKPLEMNPKMQALLAEIDELGEDEPIIIWAQFVAELKAIYYALTKDHPCGLYYGSTSDTERKRIIDDFKHGRIRIFIGNPTTAGYGLNFQNANVQLFYSNSFRTEVRLQAEDRTHRIGNVGTCLYKDIILKDTIDEKVYRVIAEGRDLNDYFKSNSLTELLSDKS